MTVFLLYQRLLEHFGPQHWWPAETPFEMALGAFLTQNTAWTNVEKAIANLRRAGALCPERLAGSSAGELENWIRPAGYYNQKADRLRRFACYLLDRYDGKVENLLLQPLEPARKELLSLKGIGPETADSILLYAGNHRSFVVDAYTHRLGQRLSLLKGGESYEKVRAFFMTETPPEASIYNEFHALIVAHCKAYCRTRPLCETCFLAQECPTAKGG